MFKTKRFNKYILFFLIIAALLILSFLIIHSITQSYYVANEKQASYDLFLQERDAALATVGSVENILLLVTSNESVMDYLDSETLPDRLSDRTRVAQMFGSLSKIDTGVCSIMFYDGEGTLTGMLGNNFFSIEEKSLIASGMHYSNVLENNGETYFHVEREVYTGSKAKYKRSGYVGLLFNTQRFQSIVDVLTIRKGSYAAIMDQSGKVLVSAGEYDPEYDRVSAGQSSELYAVVYEDVLPESGWKIVNIIPDSAFMDVPKEIRFINYITYIVVALIVTMLFITLYRQAVRGARDILELEYDKKRTEMIAYKSQINPHFMYNTLESIRGMALYKDESEIAKLTGSLSKLFRYNVKGDEIVTVEEVIKNLREYALIIDYRFMGKIRISVNVAPDPRIKSARIPKMLVQPLVENAVIHGLESRVRGGSAVVDISLNEPEEKLCISIRDDGKGMDEETLQRIRSKLSGDEKTEHELNQDYGGIGISNVSRRIKLFYGKNASISVESVFDQGTCFTLLLPLNVEG